MTEEPQSKLADQRAVLDEVIYEAVRMRPGLSAANLEIDPVVLAAARPAGDRVAAIDESLGRLHAAGRITADKIQKMYITLYRNIRPAP